MQTQAAKDFIVTSTDAQACILNAEERTVEFKAVDHDGLPVRKVVTVRDGSNDIPLLVNEMRRCGNTDIVFRELRQ